MSRYLIYDSFCFYRSRTSPKSSVGEATSLLSLLLIMVSNNPLYSFSKLVVSFFLVGVISYLYLLVKKSAK